VAYYSGYYSRLGSVPQRPPKENLRELLKEDFFAVRIHFLLPNQKCKSTEGVYDAKKIKPEVTGATRVPCLLCSIVDPSDVFSHLHCVLLLIAPPCKAV